MDEYWNKFLQSGKVDDYIKYVNNYFNSVNSSPQAEDNATDSQRLDNTGTDYRGE
ncbi:MAG: hypothetical protein IJ235_01285 [Eubacterium sp.]|nr:hypothetical protein [Eubacterium sp.]MBQ8980183.1 hypothetical protein [Eubacterium sp.]MBR1530941.1 hypothetical protein [Eubacterium sp.]